MRPKDNPEPYEHAIYEWEYRFMNAKTEDGIYYNTNYHIPTSSHSALVMVTAMAV